MPNPLADATLEAGAKVYGRAAVTDKFSELLSVDGSGVVSIGSGLTSVSIPTLDVTTPSIGGTSVTATAAEINAVADLSTYAQSATATAAGLTTGTITGVGMIQYVTVTSDSADKIIILPAPTPGRIVVLNNGATGYELRTSAPATIAINGGAEADAESAIAANSTVIAICISATAWKAIFLDADSDVAKVDAAAAA